MVAGLRALPSGLQGVTLLMLLAEPQWLLPQNLPRSAIMEYLL